MIPRQMLDEHRRLFDQLRVWVGAREGSEGRMDGGLRKIDPREGSHCRRVRFQ
jgi:hypothetical protein